MLYWVQRSSGGGDSYLITPRGNKLRSLPDAKRWLTAADGTRLDKNGRAVEAGGKRKTTGDGAHLSTRSVAELQFWVQCDTCDKWRRLPSAPDDDDDDAPWFCSMHPDLSPAPAPYESPCEVPEDNWQGEASRAAMATAAAAAEGILIGKGSSAYKQVRSHPMGP